MASSRDIDWPFYPEHYDRDTKHLTPAQHGVYFTLLCHYWLHGGLPSDDEAVRKIARVNRRWWPAICPVIKPFFKLGGWRHKRLERDLKRARQFRQRQSRNANRRWENNTGEKFASQNVLATDTTIAKPLKLQRAGDATAMPKLRTDRIPSISGSTAAVDKSGQPSKAGASFSQHKLSKQQAATAWENDLRNELGTESYARAIDILAADPDLVERATEAELRVPGSGVMAALIGIKDRLREVMP